VPPVKKDTAPAGDQPTDQTPETPADETSVEPAAGSVLRLDDPELDGEPSFAVYCGDGYIVRLGAAAKYDLPTYKLG
jgi:hypothetical protein